jgi:hypothetical protein
MTRTCTIEGCEKPHMARGWCAMHYLRWWRTGDPAEVLPPHRMFGPENPNWKGPKACSIDGCGKPHKAHGWCQMHYFRWRRTGDPEALPRRRACASSTV